MIRYGAAALEEWEVGTGALIKRYPLPSSLEFPLRGPAVYTPEGRLICLARKERRWHLWDVAARRSIARLDPQSDDPKSLITFAPIGHLFSHDGKRYYLATNDFAVRSWEVKTGKLLQVFRGHQNFIETPALSFDDKLLASGSNDKTLRIWDTQTGQCLAVVKNESATFLPSFSADGHLAASCMRALRAKIWDVPKLLASPAMIAGNQLPLISPDGEILLTGKPLVKLPSGLAKQRTTLVQQPRNYIGEAKGDPINFSPDGTKIALLKFNPANALRLYIEIVARESGEIIAAIHGHTGDISSSAFSPDGKLLASTGADDYLVKLWDTQTWREIAQFKGHKDIVESAAFSPDGKKLATSGWDYTIKVWGVARRAELFTQGHRAPVRQVRFSPDGKTIASAGIDFLVKLWDATTGQELRTLKGHAQSVFCVAFSPDGLRLASGGDDQTVRLWDLQTGQEFTALRGHTGELRQLFFTPDGRTLVLVGDEDTRIWRTATAAEVQAHR